MAQNVEKQSTKVSEKSGENKTRKVSETVAALMADNRKFFSFEYYPPRTDTGVTKLKKTISKMAHWGPQWCDVTWGAGGTTSALTPELCGYIQNNANVTCLMHLTCTNMEASKIDTALLQCKQLNIRNILALRGDPPHGETEWKSVANGFTCALDLIQYIVKTHGREAFDITCAGYPEGHPNIRKTIEGYNATDTDNADKYWAVRKVVTDKDGTFYEGATMEDLKKELSYLKAKVDSGANVIITQLFYDVPLFQSWVKLCRKHGITVPILPGIMPIRNYGSFKRMTGFCKTVIPPELDSQLVAVKDDDDKALQIGIEWVKAMCTQLTQTNNADCESVPGVHIYTMNTTATPAMILDHLRETMGIGDTGKSDDSGKKTSADWIQQSLVEYAKQKQERQDVKQLKKVTAGTTSAPIVAVSTF